MASMHMPGGNGSQAPPGSHRPLREAPSRTCSNPHAVNMRIGCKEQNFRPRQEYFPRPHFSS